MKTNPIEAYTTHTAQSTQGTHTHIMMMIIKIIVIVIIQKCESCNLMARPAPIPLFIIIIVTIYCVALFAWLLFVFSNLFSFSSLIVARWPHSSWSSLSRKNVCIWWVESSEQSARARARAKQWETNRRFIYFNRINHQFWLRCFRVRVVQ